MKAAKIHWQQGFVKTISIDSISLEYIQLTSDKAMKLTYYIQLILQISYLQLYENISQCCHIVNSLVFKRDGVTDVLGLQKKNIP